MFKLSPLGRRRFERSRKTAVAGGRCGYLLACLC